MISCTYFGYPEDIKLLVSKGYTNLKNYAAAETWAIDYLRSNKTLGEFDTWEDGELLMEAWQSIPYFQITYVNKDTIRFPKWLKNGDRVYTLYSWLVFYNKEEDKVYVYKDSDPYHLHIAGLHLLEEQMWMPCRVVSIDHDTNELIFEKYLP